MNPYIGHDSQVCGIEEHRLIGGKGDGMRLLEVTNGKGIQMTVSLDRAADISRLRYKGINMGYFSPCGYVAPAYYDSIGTNWLKSFTAGFLTTCGLQAVGSPCVDEGEEFPLHGTIANTPAEEAYWMQEGQELIIRAVIRDEEIFAPKLRLNREIRINLESNEFTISDTIENTGAKRQPMEILYHINMGYPLLDEDSIIKVPAIKTTPRDAHAAEDIENWMHMEKPQADYEERCYYHTLEKGEVSIYQPKLKTGLQLEFNPSLLDCFVEWKMMGVRDYALGLECGNCYPDGRDIMRQKGILKYINPGEQITYQVHVQLFEEP